MVADIERAEKIAVDIALRIQIERFIGEIDERTMALAFHKARIKIRPYEIKTKRCTAQGTTFCPICKRIMKDYL